MSPLDVARRMLRANCDPGLIAAYLALELERDPTIGMTALQRLNYSIGLTVRQIARIFDVPLSLLSPPRRDGYTLAAPGGER